MMSPESWTTLTSAQRHFPKSEKPHSANTQLKTDPSATFPLPWITTFTSMTLKDIMLLISSFIFWPGFFFTSLLKPLYPFQHLIPSTIQSQNLCVLHALPFGLVWSGWFILCTPNQWLTSCKDWTVWPPCSISSPSCSMLKEESARERSQNKPLRRKAALL